MMKIVLHTYLIILLLIIIYYQHIQLENKLKIDNKSCYCIKKLKRKYLGLLFPKLILILMLLLTTFTENSLKHFIGNIFVNIYIILTFAVYIILLIYFGIIITDIFVNNLSKNLESCKCANTTLNNIIYYNCIFAIIFLLILTLNTFQFFFVHNYR